MFFKLGEKSQNVSIRYPREEEVKSIAGQNIFMVTLSYQDNNLTLKKRMKIEIEKFKNLNKDIRSFPLTVLGACLVLIIAAFFGYMMLLYGDMDKLGTQNDISEKFYNQPKEPDVAVKEDAGTTEAVETVPDDKTTQEVVAANEVVKILANEDRTVFEIWNRGVKAGEIEQDYPAQVSLWREVNGNIYLGVSYTGRGGYILFGGPDEVYKLETIKNSLSKVYGREDKNGYVSDISLDEERLITVKTPVSGALSIVVYDIASQSIQPYPVPARYSTAGEARFSHAGGKILYEAAVGDPSAEEYAMFMIDLSTGKQTQVGNPEIIR
jgi:hypothetical protein